MSDLAKKRYIITYSNPNMDMAGAASILNVAANQVEDATVLLASDKPIDDTHILHYDGLGSSSMVLTDEQIKVLKNDPRVASIEEDIEFTINSSLIGTQEIEDANATYLDEYSVHTYNLGYQRGLERAYDAITREIRNLYREELMNVEAPSLRNPLLQPKTPLLAPIQPTPWNIAMVKAPQAWARGITGRNVKVAVLDTGIAQHQDLIVAGGVSMVPGVGSFRDGHGHGTHCAGIIAAKNNAIGVMGVAYDAQLYAVKVLSDAGSGSSSWILAGMAWAKNNGMSVISMSLGSSSCIQPSYQLAVNQLKAAGITVVCASGNARPPQPVSSPANTPGVIAVGAIEQNRIIADFSNYGKCTAGANPVTLVAPGVNVTSTFLNNSYRSLNGTSMACPHVAGAVALIKQRFPTLTPDQIISKLQSTSTDLGITGVDTIYGYGLLNCNLATL